MVEDWECPSQISYVYDRPVCFQVLLVNVASLSGGGGLVLNQDRTANFTTDKTVRI